MTASDTPSPKIRRGEPLWMQDDAGSHWTRRSAAADQPRHRVRTEAEHQSLAGLAPSALRRIADRKRRERERQAKKAQQRK
jgi:hypothetical protein